MGIIARELSATAVSKLSGDGQYCVGGVSGLYLQIRGKGRSWMFITKVKGARGVMGLGSYREVTLLEAREAALELRRQIRNGRNPFQERREAKEAVIIKSVKTKTFQECAEDYMLINREGWSKSNANQWSRVFKKYAYPIIGSLPVSKIDTDLVLSVLQQPVTADGVSGIFWNTYTKTASELRGRIEVVLQYAKVRGFREGENPAEWKTLKFTLPHKNKIAKVVNHPALPFTQIGAFMSELRKVEGTTARALELLILTAVRLNEALGATWDEIDFNARVWTIPAARMKMETEHRIPLSDTAIKLLQSLPKFVGSRYIFTGRKMGTKKSDTALHYLLMSMNYSHVTAHGFRSTFRDWAGETTTHAREVCEHALAHGLPNATEAAYARGTMFDKRRHLMDDWARYCDTIPAEMSDNVVSIRTKTA